VSGSEELEVPSAKLKRMEKELKEKWVRQGVVLIDKPPIDEYMRSSYDDLSRSHPDDLDKISYELARYAYYLQMVISFYHTKMLMCRREIERLVGSKIKNYTKIYGRDDKWMSAIADNAEATIWKTLEDEAYDSWKTLEYLPNRLGEMQKVVLHLQRGKNSGEV
jgi:hypothetical protein